MGAALLRQDEADAVAAAGRIAYGTTDRFADSGAAKVLAWCPTCTIQIGENVLPGRAGSPVYALEAYVVYLAGQLDRMQHKLNSRKVANYHVPVLHVHQRARGHEVPVRAFDVRQRTGHGLPEPGLRHLAVSTAQGQLLTRFATLEPGDQVWLHFSEGRARTRIEDLSG